MTRQEWLAKFEAEIATSLGAAFDLLVEQHIAAGGTPDDLDDLAERWRVEVEEQVRPLRRRAAAALRAAPDAAIVWG